MDALNLQTDFKLLFFLSSKERPGHYIVNSYLFMQLKQVII